MLVAPKAGLYHSTPQTGKSLPILQNSRVRHLLQPPAHSSIPISHLSISHWVVTTGQDLSPVTGRDFLRVQFVFLQALELVSS